MFFWGGGLVCVGVGMGITLKKGEEKIFPPNRTLLDRAVLLVNINPSHWYINYKNRNMYIKSTGIHYFTLEFNYPKKTYNKKTKIFNW